MEKWEEINCSSGDSALLVVILRGFELGGMDQHDDQRSGVQLTQFAYRKSFIFATNTAIIATTPSSALYSRCFKYKSQENPSAASSAPSECGASFGNIRGTRSAYSSNSGNFWRRNTSSSRITGR